MKEIQQFDNQKGVTLVEILASIVILALILLTFINVLLQSTTTNNTSETIIDATYVAQTAMEKLYSISNENSYSDRIEAIKDIGYAQHPDEEDWEILSKNVEDSDYNIRIKLEKYKTASENDIYRTIVEVYKGEFTVANLQAKMENALFWGGNKNE